MSNAAAITTDKEELSDIKIMKEFDNFVNDKDRDNLKNDDHLQRLLVYSDLVHKINHPSAKKKVKGMHCTNNFRITATL